MGFEWKNPFARPELTCRWRSVVAHGYQPEFGARPLRRTIQAELDNRIASLLLSGESDPGDTIVADVRDGSLHCAVRKDGTGSVAEEPDTAGSDAVQ